MKFISNHIGVTERTNDKGCYEVAFFRRQPDFGEWILDEVEWKEVEDLEAWIACFFDNVREVAFRINAGSFLIEKTAFDNTFHCP